MASRAERKQRAREARIAVEAGAAQAAARRRNLARLGVVLAVAVVALVAAILISRGGGGTSSLDQERTQAAALFAGIPQHGTQLGKPGAQFTLVEFADLQCPFCRQYTVNALPSVIRSYVRTGRLKLDFKLRTFIGPDSVTAAKVAAAAAQQSRIWPFVDVFYHRQGTENTGYVTHDFLEQIAGATPGLNADKALAAADSPAATKLIAGDESLANSLQSNSTPSFFIRRGGGPYEPLKPADLTPQAFAQALDKALS
jgi:protein-disulfide isomerase